MTSRSFPVDGAWTMPLLLDAVARGDRLKYVAFWGHKPTNPGVVGPHVLSQWFEHEFMADQIVFATAEHMMMFEKAKLFEDHDAAAAILDATSPGEAKDLGRRVRNFDNQRWQDHRMDIVRRASVAKFGSCSALRDFLVGTGQRVLVEASPRDRIWGIGADRSSGLVEQPAAWPGLNLLGFALMQARAELAGLPAPGPCGSCGLSTG